MSDHTLLWVKVGFHLLLTLPCTVIAGLCLSIALGFQLLQGTALLIATLLFAVGHAMFGMLMGLTFPKLDAVNETVVIKQSLATTLAMFVPMAVLAAAGGLYWLGSQISGWAAFAFSILLLVLLTAVCAAILSKRGPTMLRAL